MNNDEGLKALIALKMATAHKEIISGRKYFYPLAEPSYGVEEVMEAIDSMTSFKTSMWEKVREFELQFAAKYGGQAIMVNSGSSADLLIAFALLEKSGGKLKAGDEILVPAVTWPTHLWSLVMAGFKVRLIDVDPKSLNFDIESVRSSISKETRGIFVVHLLGNTGEMEKLVELCREHDLVLLEDTCEALGSKYDSKHLGSFGLASSFSFFFSHHLVTMEGGMILTSDNDFANRLRLLRAHGWTRNLNNHISNSANSLNDRYRFVTWGFNVRPTELQAGFGLEQLKRIDEFHDVRLLNASALCRGIERHSDYIETMRVDPRVKCSWFAFPLIIKKDAPFTRNIFAKYLEEHGIETRPIVAGNLAKQPAMSSFPEIEFAELPNADYIHDQGLYIGIHPVINQEQLSRVVEIIDQFFEKELATP